jgi:ubiquinone/menaquinone biosynthesis C-methylase UbiE
MKRPDFIARQSASPSGVIGRLIASIMSRETADLNERAIQLLDVRPSDRVLEVGFGHGRTVQRVIAAVPTAHVSGIDVSEAMTRVANRRNRTAASEGRVDLRTGDSAALPFPDGQFDCALAVHTLYFWKDPSTCLREIRRVLRPNARFVLGFTKKSSSHAASFPAEVYTFHEESTVEAMLLAAGFESIELTPVGEAVLASAVAARARARVTPSNG